MTHEEYIVQALDALQYSYSPYSHFRVGACLVCEDGKTYKGANFENASYGATICAERAAVCKAVSEGATRFTAIAVVGSGSYAWPCGICRQVLNEFSDHMRVIAGHAGHGYEAMELEQLLPKSFGPESL